MYSNNLALICVTSYTLLLLANCDSAGSADSVKGYIDQTSDFIKGVDKKYLPQSYSKLTLTTGVKTTTSATTTTTTTTTTEAPYVPSTEASPPEELCQVPINPSDVFIVTRVCNLNSSKSAQSVVLDSKSISLVYHTDPNSNTYYNKFKGFLQGKTYLKGGDMNLNINIDPMSVGFNNPPVSETDVFLITVIRQGGYGNNRVVSQMVNHVRVKPAYLPTYQNYDSHHSDSGLN